MRKGHSALLVLSILAAFTGLVIPASAAHAPATAASYINPDTGAATANQNVAPNSECDTPDQEDTQQLSDPGATNRNVHNDACLVDGDDADFSGTVTFESTGVGSISACPDPDSVTDSSGTVTNGPGVAYTHDHDDDGSIDHCHQTEYQTKGAEGDDEYHVRLNNSTTPGDQNVTFCFDPEQDPAADIGSQPAGHGCADQTDALSDSIVIHWTADAPAPAEAVSYINPDAGAPSENSDVNPDSDCDAPDRQDTQQLSDAGTTNRNVHNDSCLFDAEGDNFNGLTTYESTGVGSISACPDPDSVTDSSGAVTSNGPGVAYTHDHDGDGAADHCHQTAFQSKGSPGDGEYHVRLNNTMTAGTQNVVFCSDPEQDPAAAVDSQPSGHGCGDAEVQDAISIRWTAAQPEPDPEPQEIRHARTIKITRVRHVSLPGKNKPALLIKGAVTSSSDRNCATEVPVKVQVRAGGEWVTRKSDTTNGNGVFKVLIRDVAAKYRARATKFEVADPADNVVNICTKATALRRHRH